MAHWADDYLTQLESTCADTGWTLTTPTADTTSERGPVVCEHDDGSELSMVNPPMGTFSIEYNPAEGTRAFNDDPSFGSVENAMEMFEHILTRHETKNYQ